MSIERRRFPRIKYDFPVKFKTISPNASAPFKSALGKDISEGGLCFSTDSFVGVGSKLMLELPIPEKNYTIRAVAKPAWVRGTADVERYEMGSSFLEMSEFDKQLLRDFVDANN